MSIADAGSCSAAWEPPARSPDFTHQARCRLPFSSYASGVGRFRASCVVDLATIPDSTVVCWALVLEIEVQQVIGLIGGMSWESSAEYYRIINQAVRARLGGVHSARILMWSFDFGEVEALQHAGRWDAATALMVDAAQRLERGGADFALICTNTMHRMADQVQAGISIPLIHIADPTAERIRAAGLSRIGLLGTAFTMEQAFYKGRLSERYGLDVLVPNQEDRARVHHVIYDELVQGRVKAPSRDAFRGVIAHLVAQGAEAIILGCTEIMLLVQPEDSSVPLFDTTAIHAEAAVERALQPAHSQAA